MVGPASTLAAQERAEHLASRFPPLLVAAERVASTVAQGVHGRRRVGQGEAFWQFRRYGPGDQANHIDWRQSAKSQHIFVRESEWEAAQSIWMWRDTSPRRVGADGPCFACRRGVASDAFDPSPCGPTIMRLTHASGVASTNVIQEGYRHASQSTRRIDHRLQHR